MIAAYLNPLYFGVAVCLMGSWLILKAFAVKKANLELVWSQHNESELSEGDYSLASEISAENLRSKMESGSMLLIGILGSRFKKISADLELADISSSQQAYLKIRTALMGVAVSFGFVYFFRYLEITGESIVWLLFFAGVGGAAGFMLPDRKAKEIAEKRRESLRGALSAYMDLLRILLAGGSHTDGALYQAASAGKGWAFGKIKAAIDWSKINGQPVTAGFMRLANQSKVAELEELSAVISLAEKEGTSLKETLSHRAELMSVKELAEARAKSHNVAEKMSLPTVVIAISFVAFIAYPALASLTAGSV